MIIFEKIRWKNFLSTGNNFIEMDLRASTATLVIGQNGSGKSTMLDALCFALFNKPFRKITRGQLVNSVNEKGTIVEIEFTIGSLEYKVVRGIKPNVFEIYRNGSLLDQDAAAKDYQKYLEQSILRLNFKSFTQVVILGSSTFVPFMQLSAPHRREVIEDLLDIQVFSQMNSLLKDRVKDTREEMKNCKHELAMVQQEVDLREDNIKNLESQSGAYTKAKEERMTSIDTEVKELMDIVLTLEPKVVDLEEHKSKYDKLKEYRTKIKQNLTKSQKDIVFFESNDSCPTCTQTIDPAWKEEHVSKINAGIEKYNAGVDDISGKIKATIKEIKATEKISEEISEKRYTINSLMKEQFRICQELKEGSPNLDSERESLEGLISARDEKQSICSNVNQRNENYKVVGNLLKDGGIKTKIIRKFIPTINHKINKYLAEMDFFVNFTLDEEFNEVIKSRYRDVFTYSSFSEGEKQKIDLALLFTWRSIAKLKNSANTNLLILDEVFDSSLDTSSTEELLKILKTFREAANMFVISHKGDVLLDKFPRTVKFNKENDFSHMSEE